MQRYRWTDIPVEPMNAKVSRQVIHGANMTLARIVLAEGATVPRHAHVNEQVSTVERGAVHFFFEGADLVVREGESVRIPPDAPHEVRALEDSVVLDVFSPARADWISGDDSYLRR